MTSSSKWSSTLRPIWPDKQSSPEARRHGTSPVLMSQMRNDSSVIYRLTILWALAQKCPKIVPKRFRGHARVLQNGSGCALAEYKPRGRRPCSPMICPGTCSPAAGNLPVASSLFNPDESCAFSSANQRACQCRKYKGLQIERRLETSTLFASALIRVEPQTRWVLAENGEHSVLLPNNRDAKPSHQLANPGTQ